MKRNTLRLCITAIVLSTLLVASLAFAGCGKKDQSGQSTSIVVVDMLGREVELPAVAQRVVTNYGIATQIVFALGQQDKLVGCDEPSQRTNSSFFSQIDPDFAGLPTIGNPKQLNTESIAALQPDVIFVPCSRGPEQVDQLAALGFKVLGVNCEDLDLLARSVEMFGQAMGCEDKAAEYVSYYQETRSMIEDRLSDLPDSQRIPVYLAGSTGVLSTCGGDMYQSSLFDLCGGRNVAQSLTGGWKEVSAEQLITWNPQEIMVVHYGPGTPEQITTDSTLAEISAVKEGEVMWFPSQLAPWDYPSMQAVLGLVWCAKTLHPDKFTDVDVLQYANDYFEEFFGKSFTELGGVI